jgi:elongation factor 1-beta
MAHIIVTLKIMPESPDVNLASLIGPITTVIESEGGSVSAHEEEPIGFGIKALLVTFSRNESLGNLDPIEEKVAALTGVEGCESTNVRRALG